MLYAVVFRDIKQRLQLGKSISAARNTHCYYYQLGVVVVIVEGRGEGPRPPPSFACCPTTSSSILLLPLSSPTDGFPLARSKRRGRCCCGLSEWPRDGGGRRSKAVISHSESLSGDKPRTKIRVVGKKGKIDSAAVLVDRE